jgi:hypothetical protein
VLTVLAEVLSFTRPPMAANAMAHTEWNLATLEAAGVPLLDGLSVLVQARG